MIKCPKCGAENPDNSKFCNNCGFNFNKNKKAKKPLKIFLIVLVSLIVVGGVALGVITGISYVREKQWESLSNFERLGFSAEQNKALIEELNSVGIKNISSFGISSRGTDTITLPFEEDHKKGTLILKNEKVYFISWNDIVIFDAEKGGKLDGVDRYTLSDGERDIFISIMKDFLKQGLDAPLTASFHANEVYQTSISRKDDVVTLNDSFYVYDGVNSRVEMDFIMQISYSTHEYTYLEIDGKVISGKMAK